MRLKKEIKSQLQSIKEYLLKNGEITTKQADEFGWDRIRQNIYTLKQKGMNIISSKTKHSGTIYKLVDKNENENEFEIIDLGEETPPTADDMKIKTSMKEVILDHLKKHGSITSFDAMGRYNCLNLYVIIKYLKKDEESKRK